MPGERVLIVDDEAGHRESVRRCLHRLPVEVRVAKDTAGAIRLLSREPFHAVLCDLKMPGGGGCEVLRFVQSRGLQIPVIFMTGSGDAAIAEECVTAGALDFLAKPVDLLSLQAVLRRAFLRSGHLFEPTVHPLPGPPRPHVPDLVGQSEAMQEVLSRVAKVAAAEANVCIYGETGTGKELVARAIHRAGPRAQRPLIVLDCAAVPEGLLESEMFGHVRGAFTSAGSDREGVFQLADGGTLLLDEIGELSLPLQAKLLRVIQFREFRKVGGQDPIRVNVRLLAATNKDFRAMVAEGRFREDLLYRLEVIPLTLPPLRQRKEDIPPLLDHFIARFNRKGTKQIRGVSSSMLVALLRYDWPGNVRELENCIERAAVMADTEILDLRDPGQILQPAGRPFPPSPSNGSLWPCSLKDAEQDLILKTLQILQGNRTRAAELLGISLRGLQYKLKEMQREGVFSGDSASLGSKLATRPPPGEALSRPTAGPSHEEDTP